MKLSREHVVKDEVSPRRSWLLSYNYPTFIMTLRLRYLDTIVLDLVSVFRYSIGGDPGKSILLVDALFWLWSHHFDWRKKTLRIKFLQYCLVCLTDSITRRGQLSSAVSSVSNFFHSFKVASESTRLMDALRKPSQDGLILNSTCLLIIFATSFVCVEPRSLLIDSSPLVTRGILHVASSSWHWSSTAHLQTLKFHATLFPSRECKFRCQQKTQWCPIFQLQIPARSWYLEAYRDVIKCAMYAGLKWMNNKLMRIVCIRGLLTSSSCLFVLRVVQ